MVLINLITFYDLIVQYHKYHLKLVLNFYNVALIPQYIDIFGLNALPGFNFKESNNYYKTFISQEFLKRNILATNGIYICIDHTEKKIQNYFEIMDEIFYKISQNNEAGNDPAALLENEVCITNIRESN